MKVKDLMPTPIIDAAAVNRWHASNGKPMQTPMIEDHLISTARCLERRMRAAENLLQWLLCESESNTPAYLNNAIKAAREHLEAAMKEDNR